MRVAKNMEEANKYWLARRTGNAAIYAKARTIFVEDVTVPIKKLPALTKKCKELAGKYNLEIVVVGHAGDGNLHPAILSDIKDKDLYERSMKAVDEIIEAAIEMGGSFPGSMV